MSQLMKFRLGDHAIGCFIQSVQAALLTGTDISDLMRHIQLECEPVQPGAIGVLEPTAAYIDAFNASMDEMMERAMALAEQDVRVEE